MVEKKQLEIDNTFFFTRYTKEIKEGKEIRYPADIKSYLLEEYLDLWYGFSDSINIRLILPFSRWSYEYEDLSTTPAEIKKQAEAGPGDFIPAVKFKARDNLFIFTGIKLDNASTEKNLGTGSKEPFISIIYKRPIAWTVDLTANVTWQYDSRVLYSSYNYGLILNYGLTEKIELCLETFLEREETAYNRFSLAPGITWQFTENIYGGLGCQFPVKTGGNLEEAYDYSPYFGIFYIK